jgi:proteasome lid subunit RPN8/RPN11
MGDNVILKKSFGISKMQVQWSLEFRQQMEGCAVAAFPEECCGFLFGSQTAGGWMIREVRASKNLSATPRTGFQLDDREQVAAMTYADAKNCEIIGYYHSHPNGRRGPSPTDFILWGGDPKCLSDEERSRLPADLQNTEIPRLPDHALQLIIAIEHGVVTGISAWHLRRDLSGFDQIDLEFVR